jgi:hypothetical protein
MGAGTGVGGVQSPVECACARSATRGSLPPPTPGAHHATARRMQVVVMPATAVGYAGAGREVRAARVQLENPTSRWAATSVPTRSLFRAAQSRRVQCPRPARFHTWLREASTGEGARIRAGPHNEGWGGSGAKGRGAEPQLNGPRQPPSGARGLRALRLAARNPRRRMQHHATRKVVRIACMSSRPPRGLRATAAPTHKPHGKFYCLPSQAGRDATD